MAPKRIAVIGGGISGLGAAYSLACHSEHSVVLYEAQESLGGHAHTVDIARSGTRLPVDVGFIVYNEATYPNLVRFFDELGVETEPSDMSFSFCEHTPGNTGVQYSGSAVGLLANRSMIISRRYRTMVRDILRFRRDGSHLKNTAGSMTMRDLLAQHGYSAAFVEDYLIPMTAAVWSSPNERVLDYPARSLLSFLDNHGLITVTDAPPWRTVTGGSRAYVDAASQTIERHGGDIRLASPVRSVDDAPQGAGGPWRVTSGAGVTDRFDDVIFATHSDQTVAMLGSRANDAERRVLAGVRYQDNVVVLHADASVMPNVRRHWASWNSRVRGDRRTGPTTLTYWMSKLQNLEVDDVFVTLNPSGLVDQANREAEYRFAHPQFDTEAVDAQRELASIQGRRGLWFAGAWCGYGFHEDGLQSGLVVAEALGGAPPWLGDVEFVSSAPSPNPVESD